MRDSVFSVRLSERDVRALDSLSACLGCAGRGEVIRAAIRELALRHGLWNVTHAEALPLLSGIDSNAITTKEQGTRSKP